MCDDCETWKWKLFIAESERDRLLETAHECLRRIIQGSGCRAYLNVFLTNWRETHHG